MVTDPRRVAAAIGTLLALVGVAVMQPSPPDYWITGRSDDAFAKHVAAATGTRAQAGSIWTQNNFTSIGARLDSGEEIEVVLTWSDVPRGFTWGHRHLLHESLEGCVRIRVTSPSAIPMDPKGLAGLDGFLHAHVRSYLDDLPRDPCLGRPLAP